MRSFSALLALAGFALASAASCQPFNVTASPATLLGDAIVTAIVPPSSNDWAIIATDSCNGEVKSKVSLAKVPPPPSACASSAWLVASLAPSTLPGSNHTAVVGSLVCDGAPAAASIVFAVDVTAQTFLWAATPTYPNGSVWREEYAAVTPFPAVGTVAVFAFVTGHTAGLDIATGNTVWARNIKTDFNCPGDVPLARNVPAWRPALSGTPLPSHPGAPPFGTGGAFLGCAVPVNKEVSWMAMVAVHAGTGALLWRTDLSSLFPSNQGFGATYLAGFSVFGDVLAGVENVQGAGDGLAALDADNGDILASTRLQVGYSLHGVVPDGSNTAGVVGQFGTFTGQVCSSAVVGLDGDTLAQKWTADDFNASLPAKVESATCGGHLYGMVPSGTAFEGSFLVWNEANALPGSDNVSIVTLVDATTHKVVATLNLAPYTIPTSQFNEDGVVGGNSHGVLAALGSKLYIFPWTSFTAA